MKPVLTQREVNALVQEAFRPTAEAAERMWGDEERAAGHPWAGFCWGVGAGHSLFDTSPDSPIGVHVDGARGRMRFFLPYSVAYEVAERVAAERPEVHARIEREWWEEMAADAREGMAEDARFYDEAEAGWAA